MTEKEKIIKSIGAGLLMFGGGILCLTTLYLMICFLDWRTPGDGAIRAIILGGALVFFGYSFFNLDKLNK